jgi:DNA-binding GntR family transcriptional regulator
MQKRHQVYSEIKRRILSLELKPDQRILENEIIEKMQIGRTPVREALLVLENEKLIRCENKAGYFVRRLNTKEVSDYISIRRMLELYAIPRIIRNITPLEIKLLQKNLKDTENAIKHQDHASLVQNESTFHELLYKATKSSVFIDIISHLSDKFQWLRAIGTKNAKGVQRSLSQHAQIVDAIIKKDESGLKELIDKHINNLKDSVAIARDYFLLDE